MNERIREIAKQAYIADASKLPNWKFKPETEFLLKQLGGFNEKFAELIVEEFRAVLVDVYHKTPLELCGPLLTLDEKIVEHFGVEK